MASEWTHDLSELPVLPDSFVDAYYDSKTASERHKRRSYNFTTESYVSLPSLRTKRLTDSSVPAFLVRCVCFRSRKKTSAPYEITIKLTTEPCLQHGRCTCPAGSAGYCNHLMAVLENLVILQSKGYKEAPGQLAPTELPQQWRRPRQAMAPELVMDVNWRKVADGRPDSPLPCRLYDSRKRARTEAEQRDAAAKLANSLGAFNCSKSFVDTLLEASACNYVDTQFGRAPRGSGMDVQLALQPSGYERLVSLERCDRRVCSTMPAPFCFFDGADHWRPGLDDDVELLQDLVLTTDEAQNLERDTRQQSSSPLWQEARLNRLTASKFSLVLKRVHPWTYAGLRNIFRPKPFTSVAVRYGVSKEGDAVRRYVDVLKDLGRDVVVYNCGIMVRPGSPWLGASPDRVVYDPSEDPPFGLIEVKCPYTKRATLLKEAVGDADFFIEVVDKKPRLKFSSGFYSQVMGQMYCAGLLWTHFVVYAPAWIVVARVAFCEPGWEQMKDTLDLFYFEHAVPYLASLSV